MSTFAALAFAALVAAVDGGPAPENTAPAHSVEVRVGERAPPFTLDALEGAHTSLASWQGAPVVLLFVATWCPVSRKLAPAFDAIARDFPRDHFALVDIAEDRALVTTTWRDKKKLALPVLLDTDAAVARAYAPGPELLGKHKPEDMMTGVVVVIGPDGRIRDYPWVTGVPDFTLAWLRAALSTPAAR